MRINGNRTKPAITALIAVALLAGCASSGPTELLAPRPEPVQPEGPLASVRPPETVTIDAIEIAQTDDAARIDIQTSEALVWTTYRDESGHLVVELPNSEPGADISDLEASSGLVEAVRVTGESVGSRPLTRLRIMTRSEAEHSVSAAQHGLGVELGSAEALAMLPEAGEGPMAAEAGEPESEMDVAEAAALEQDDLADAEPTAWPEGEETWSETAVAEEIVETTVWESEALADEDAVVAMDDGSSAEPAETWTPLAMAAGQPATELRDIDVVRIDDSVVVRIMGDGEFSYQTLSLESPYRYVVDLAGVANYAPHGTYDGSGGEPVEQVRVAQFKSQPDPVSRVVVDLAYPVTPELVGLPDGLALSFGGAAAASWSATSTLVDDVAEPVYEEPVYEEPALEEAAYEPVVELAADPAPVYEEQVYEEAPAAYEDAAADDPVVEQYADASLTQDPAPMAEEAMPEAEEPMPAVAEPYVEPATPEAPAAPVNIEFAEAADEDPSELYNSQDTSAGGQKVYRGEPITLSLKDADIRDLLRSFSEFSGLNFVIQPSVRGTVTVQLTDVPWDQALDLILKTNDLGYELEGNILRIAPLSKLREEAEAEQRLQAAKAQALPLATVIKRVSYAQASQVAQVLQSGANSVLSRRGTVIVDGRTNTLIIKELPNFIDTVIAVIETLDIPEPQVMIEARIIETTKRFSRTLGINWGFDAISSAATGNTTNLVFPNNGTIGGDVNLAQAGNGTLGISLGNVLNTFQLDVALQAAETDGLINILSAPRITTLNNESASIQSGLQIPIQTVANNTVSVQFVNATLSLNVTPHVTAEGTVLMDINIQKREPLLAFAVAGSANAPISTKDARTRVIVRDGGTTVIGGIYEVTSDEGQDKVPGLSKVPLLKHLFKNNRQSEENEELLIFITPRVVNL
jgi:type IV pilus assembly protein PilQ